MKSIRICRLRRTFKTWIVFAILGLALPQSALACATPLSGPEFDKHLRIETVDEQSGKYRVIALKKIDDRNAEFAALAYYEKPFQGLDKPRMPIHFDEIELAEEGPNLMAVFDLAKARPDLYATVRVRYGGFCTPWAELVVEATLDHAVSDHK